MTFDCHVVLPFPNEKLAKSFVQVMTVDNVPLEDKVQREFIIDVNNVKVSFRATDAKSLRTATFAFLDSGVVVLKTMQEFSEM